MDETAESPGESLRSEEDLNGNGSHAKAAQPLAAAPLIDAGASLDPSDRALLQLWVSHGLPDAAIGEMTGMAPEAIAERRRRIIELVSGELNRPAGEVAAALAAPAARYASDTNGNGRPPTRAAESRRRRRLLLWLSGAAVFMCVVVVALTIALSGGTAKSAHRAAPSPPRAAAATAAAPPPSIPGPAPAARAGRARAPTQASAVPARALRHSHGTAELVRVGRGKRLRLKLIVKALPPARKGHYEVWLYNSRGDARALGRLRNGKRRLTVKLPKRAGHYRWIDISFQAPGAKKHSRESVLRSRNPARATPKQLRKRAARRRQLRRLASGSSSASKSK